jgi:hypothetical protein
VEHSDEKVTSPFFFEEPMVTSDRFLPTMENNHVSVRTLFQLGDAPPHFTQCVHALLDRKFPDCWLGRGGPIP